MRRSSISKIASLAGTILILLMSMPAIAGTFNLNLATTNINSGNYPWAVGVSEVVNKHVEGASCRLIALGGAGLTVPALKTHQANFSTNITSWDMADIVAGTGKWAKLGGVPMRMFCLREFGYQMWFVAKSAGVKNVMDLKGKKINIGAVGAATEGQAKLIDDALNIGADWTYGSTGTASEQISDRQVIGYIKSCPSFPEGSQYMARFDSSALNISTSVPLTVVGLTKEQRDTVVAKYPKFKKFLGKIPAGAIEQAPDAPELWMTTMAISAMVSMADVPQDIQYRVIKAMAEHWKDIVAVAYPPCGVWDPIKDTIENTPDGVQLAAGVVQYALEKGYDVPAELIPSEYKKK